MIGGVFASGALKIRWRKYSNFLMSTFESFMARSIIVMFWNLSGSLVDSHLIFSLIDWVSELDLNENKEFEGVLLGIGSSESGWEIMLTFDSICSFSSLIGSILECWTLKGSIVRLLGFAF